MSLVSRYRLQFLIAWLAMDGRVRAALSPRQIPSVVGLLGQARAMQQMLHPWLVAVLSRRERLAWTLHLPERPGSWAALAPEDVPLEAFDFWELRRWQTPWLQYLLEAELARLVWRMEAPCLLMSRPGWDRWEVARWALATCLARISQLARALEERQRDAPASVGLSAALEVVWQRLAVGSGRSAA